jgi:hypothetical protein
MMRVLVMVLAFVLAAPLFAQVGGDSREAELRQWFDSLPESRKAELKHRLRAFKRLPEPRQREMLQAAKEGREVLTEKQRENIRRLRRMDNLERVRLYTTGAELQLLRRARGADFDEAMNLEGPERVQRLREMLHEHRRLRFFNDLPPEEREALRRMPPRERERAMHDRYRREREERLNELEKHYPRVSELRQAAEDGDRDARRQLRQTMADLRTLDMLLQRLGPKEREVMLQRIGDRTIEQTAEEVRKALQRQWQQESRQRPKRRPEPGDRGPAGPERGDRGSMRPEREGGPDRQRRREQ